MRPRPLPAFLPSTPSPTIGIARARRLRRIPASSLRPCQAIFPDLVSQGPDGYLTLNYAGFTPYIVKAVRGIANEVVSLEATVAGFAQSFTSRRITASDQLCVGTTCIDQQQLAALLAAQSGAATSGGTVALLSTSTPPTVALVVANPSMLTVGDSYIDQGVVATDNQGHSLSDQTLVYGALESPISIDTNNVTTDTIDYVATDTWGNTTTTTREVIIRAATPTP